MTEVSKGQVPPASPGILERGRWQVSGDLLCQIQSQPLQSGTRLAGKERGLSTFPLGPPGNELFRVELGCGQRSFRGVERGQGPRGFGLQRKSCSHPVPPSPSCASRQLDTHSKDWDWEKAAGLTWRGRPARRKARGGALGPRKASLWSFGSPAAPSGVGPIMEIEIKVRRRDVCVPMYPYLLANVYTQGTQHLKAV